MLGGHLEGWGVEGRFKREGIYVYIWLIHFLVQHKLIQHCTATIFSIKKKQQPMSECVNGFVITGIMGLTVCPSIAY